MALGADPSATGMLARRFFLETSRRLGQVSRSIREKIVLEDCFGLDSSPTHVGNSSQTLQEPPQSAPEAPAPSFPIPGPGVVQNARGVWAHHSPGRQVLEFSDWLEKLVEEALAGGEWARALTESAYYKGATRAFVDLRKFERGKRDPGFFAGTTSEFLRAFRDDAAESQVKLLQARTEVDLKSLAGVIVSALNKELLEDFISSPTVNAKKDSKRINSRMQKKLRAARRNARITARTEMVRDHAEGQLDAFEELGVEKVGLYAEWTTAGDDRVCPACKPLEGVQFTIEEARGLIPRHRGCRCCWMPSEVKAQNQRKRTLRRRIGDSLLAEAGKWLVDEGKELAQKSTRLDMAKAGSVWRGKKLWRPGLPKKKRRKD